MGTLKAHMDQVQNPCHNDSSQAIFHNNITLEALAQFADRMAADLSQNSMKPLRRFMLYSKLAADFRSQITLD